MMTLRATAIGFLAVLLWALLALLTVGSAPVPPLLLNTVCFSIGAAAGVIWIAIRGSWGALLEVPLSATLFGILGLFGYHFLYFSALRLAPPAEAGLIAYLWPLLIVLFSGLLPGERLTFWHVLGALIALGGAALILSGGTGGDAGSNRPLGLALAFGCALVWSLYSVGSRRFGDVPSEAVTLYCLGAAGLSLIAHLALETPAWPVSSLGWVSLAALGLGPVGLAFFFWDVGCKRGDIQLLGVSAYAAPVLSTVALVLAGIAPATGQLAFAALLVAGGAALATLGSQRARSQ